MPERFLEAAKSGLAVVGAIIALVLWGARLEFQVQGKANREELRDAETLMHRVDERTRRTEELVQRLVCRQYPSDTSCE